MTMRNFTTTAALMLAMLICTPLLAAEENVSPAYVQGEQLLAKADFDGALTAFGQAVKAERTNPQYRQAYMVLRKVIRMREALAAEQNPAKRQELGDALRAFYYDNRIYSEAVAIDRERYQREKTDANALSLAETLLAAGENSQAAQVLAERPETPADKQWLTVRALAAARLGQKDEARQLLAQANQAEGAANPYVMMETAQVKMLLADQDGAMAELTNAFAMTPPSRQPVLRAMVADCAEFAAVQKAPAFTEALATPSQIQQSSCSGGSSCGSCRLSSSCSSSGGDGCSTSATN